MSSDVSFGVNHPALPLSFTRAPSDSELALLWSTYWGELLPTIIGDQLDHWHPFLRLPTAMAFNKLSLLTRGSATVLIRREYRELTKDLEQDSFGNHNRKLLTGHPGVGKSVCLHYLLLHRFSHSKPVIWQQQPDIVWYFDATGAYSSKATIELNTGFIDVLNNSWTLIDIDDPDWLPSSGSWLQRAMTLVWASFPSASRQALFSNQFGGSCWYMQPWTETELRSCWTMLAGTELQEHLGPLSTIFPFSGPIPRTIFHSRNRPRPLVTEKSVRLAIDRVLRAGIIECIRRTINPPLADYGDEFYLQVFLLQPYDEGTTIGEEKLNRAEPDVNILSPRIAELLLEQVSRSQERLQTVWSSFMGSEYGELSAARTIVEFIVRRSLTKNDLFQPEF